MKEALWVEAYRPKTISETILPDDLKNTFLNFVQAGTIPNLLLTGRAGIGKTTVAKALLNEIAADYIVINGSMHGNIDTLRTDITNFASSVSFKGGRKYVILDEADYLNPNSTQPALRNFIESYSKNCGFILTCNFKNRIIDPLHSRMSIIDFTFPKDQKPKLASLFFKRVQEILKKENVEFDSKAVGALIVKYFPDCRRILNELQRYSSIGKIDTGILAFDNDETLSSLIEFLKNKEFSNVRKWVGEYADLDATTFFRKLYDQAYTYMDSPSVAQLVLILARYQYQHAFVADHEINLVACLTEIMMECTFK